MTETPDLMTSAQVRKILQVSDVTLYRYRRDGILKATKVGGTYRYRREEIERLTSSQEPTQGK